MIWFPCHSHILDICTQSQAQIVEIAPSSSILNQNHNFSQLLQQCENCQNLKNENQQLKRQIQLLKAKSVGIRTRKIKRRTENQLTKNFKCPFLNSLNLHMKIKHRAGSKRDRLSFADQIIRAEIEGRQKPKGGFDLPPEYLQSLKSQRLEHQSRKHQTKYRKQIQIQSQKQMDPEQKPIISGNMKSS